MTTLILLISVLAGQLQDSSACRLLGRWPFGAGEMTRDLVNDTLAYVNASGGMYILNVKDPASITKVGELQTPGMPYFFSVHDTLLCVGEDKAGVALYSIADPSRPRPLGRCQTPDRAFGTAFDGRYAYVACSDSGVRVVDYLDPGSPGEVAALSTPSEAVCVELHGGLLYVSARTNGVRIADVSDPRNPCEIGAYELGGSYAQSFRVRDSLLYVAFAESGLVVLNVSNPVNPVKLSSIGAGWWMDGLAVAEDFAYTTIENPPQIKVINVSDPVHPYLASTYRPPREMAFYGVAARANRLYTVLERSNPRGGFQVVDVSDPANPALAGTFPLPLYTEVVVTADTFAFTGIQGGGVEVYSIADPSNIFLLGETGDTSRIGRLFVDRPYVYAAVYNSNFFQVVDVSDPRNPVIVGKIDSLGYGHDVAVRSGLAYVSVGEYLRIIDVSAPAQPTQVAKLKLPSSAFGLDLSGDYCYVADWYGGIQVVDVSDPTNPVVAASCPTPYAAAVDLVVRGDYVYYSDVQGFGILDVRDPRNPNPVAYESLPLPAVSWGIDAMFTMVFVALGDDGLGVYDATDPAHPMLTGYYRTPRWAYHVSVRDNIAYVADLAGFCIVQYYGQGVEERSSGRLSSDFEVLGTVAGSTLQFNLGPTRTSCQVALLDVGGRTRCTRNFTAAETRQGRVTLDVSRLAAGVYFAEVRGQPQRKVVKVLLAR